MAEARALRGPWEVRSQSGWGGRWTARFDELIPWSDHADEDIRYFSGIAEYHYCFELPEDWLAEDRRVLVDLGDLWAVGEVFLNGRALGVLWKPPFVVDITSAALPARNTLVVEVANTWSNRLVGDARLPKDERFTRTNVLQTGGRVWKDTPLLKSGLFGPVRLLPAKVLVAEPR